jgi:hypothetical protein
MNRALSGIGIVVLAAVMASATPGSFRGVLVANAESRPGWIYVQSRNEVLRLVRIDDAAVSYAEGVPADQRLPDARRSLLPGAEVRVLAESDRDGNWNAREVEIIRLAPARKAGR